ncbi:MAG: acetoin dehydrogenase dihydrolipoyllysine-residue acetyltransferase subunit [Geminicoccales bacterium]
MPTEVIMPKVDMDMSSGRIVAWHVAAGDRVEKGSPLFDIETDKAAMEVEAQGSGILRHPVDEGVDVPIGKPVAWLYAEDESGAGDPPVGGLLGGSQDSGDEGQEVAGDAEDEPEPSRSAVPSVGEIETSELEDADKVRATPLARRLADEAGLDLLEISGSGARGRVQAENVRAVIEAWSESMPSAPFVADSGPLAITRSGGDTGLPILLLHGFASDAASWSPLEGYLEGHPIIRMDLPGHGRSPKLRIDSFAGLVAEVRKAFDRLKVEKVHLIGHSLGGALALALADTREHAFESLTLIAPAGLGPDINGATLDGISKATRPESLAPWLKMLVVDEKLVTDGFVRAAMAGRCDSALRAAQQALSDILFPDGVQAFDLKSALHRVDVPARIIWGRQDKIIPWRHALHAPGRVALHLLDGIGHIPQIESPAEIGKIIRASL